MSTTLQHKENTTSIYHVSINDIHKSPWRCILTFDSCRSRTNSLPYTQSNPHSRQESPATINIYFRGDQTPPEKRTPELYRSPVHGRHPSYTPYSPHSRSLSPDELINVYDKLQEVHDDRSDGSGSTKARRKSSYLSAVNSPRSKCKFLNWCWLLRCNVYIKLTLTEHLRLCFYVLYCNLCIHC